MKRPTLTSLQGKTLDIINVIRENASLSYQDLVPEITDVKDIPKVGECIFGAPANMNQFVSALINRIAKVQMYNASFNNRYKELKKGMLEWGETVEEIFTDIIAVQEFSVEKAPQREFKRYLPDVKSAFHIMNWRVQYPLTVQRNDLQMAFLSAEKFEDFVMNLIDRMYTAQEYDEFLLFKYMLIKGISGGLMHVEQIGSGDLKNAAVKFRSISNMMLFMKNNMNNYGVLTTTPKDRQVIFMDTSFNSAYDVNVLASAFNMDKADYQGKLMLIDDFTTFDNERWKVIRENSDMIEEVTEEELALCANVKAVLLDKNWFQFYDNLFEMDETKVSSGMYWNYFLNVWKTISWSPFANAVAFVADSADVSLPDTLTAVIEDKITNDVATLFTVHAGVDDISLVGGDVKFVQTEALTTNGIAVTPYGGIMIPANNLNEITLVVTIGDTVYTATTTISSANNVGAQVTLNKES